MITRTLSLAAALALSLATSGAYAQATKPAATPAMAPAATTAAPAATTPAPTTPMKKAMKPRTAQSLECSKKADAANVHGKPRKAFMSKCKAGKA